MSQAVFPEEDALDLVRRSLDEDLGDGGDITTLALFPRGRRIETCLVAREDLVVAALPIAALVFDELERRGQGAVEVELLVTEGAKLPAGTEIARIKGDARAVLSGERLMLNAIARFSGVATVTAAAVEEVAGSSCTVSDTRKTTPGLRMLEKYAVAVGGGENHRARLDSQILVKDNHKELIGGIAAALAAVTEAGYDLAETEFEVETLDEFRLCLEAGVGWILLDNMGLAEIREAARVADGRCRLEVSGGVRPGALRERAEAGVDRLSMGFLTHSVRSMDMALDLVPPDSA